MVVEAAQKWGNLLQGLGSPCRFTKQPGEWFWAPFAGFIALGADKISGDGRQ